MNWLTRLFLKSKKVAATASHSESESKKPMEENISTDKMQHDIKQNSDLKNQDKNPDVVEQTIFNLMHASVWYEKEELAEKLGSLGDSRAIDALVCLFDTTEDNDNGAWEIRYAACTSLGKLRAVDALIKALKHRSTTVAYGAAENLGNIGDIRAIASLKSVVETHTDHDVRDAAKKALYQLGASSEMSQSQLDESLLQAASEGDIENVKILLDKGANPNARGLFDSTPLTNALANGHTTVAQILRDRLGVKGVRIIVESNLASMLGSGIITPPETMVSSIDRELADGNWIQHGDFIDYIQKNGFVSPVICDCLSDDERLKLIESQFPDDRWACCGRITEGSMTRYNVVVAFWK